MHVVAISTVRNEADIVEAFVRHTATFTDRHLIIDHGSTDGTTEILNAMAAEGIALDITRVDRPGSYQAELLTALAREACDPGGVDWVLPLDADEFLVIDSGRPIVDLLSTHTTPVFVTWRTYVPHEGDHAGEVNPVLRLGYRRSEEIRTWEKVMLPAPFIVGHPLAHGSHNIVIDGEHRRWPVLAEATLAHFPIRTPEQWAVKVAIGSFGWAIRGLDHKHGTHYRDAISLLVDDWEAFQASFRAAALRFALKPDDPVPPELVYDPIPYLGGPLRYTGSPRSSEPLRSIIEYTLDLARQFGRDQHPNAP